jgi:hypothetical protein
MDQSRHGNGLTDLKHYASNGDLPEWSRIRDRLVFGKETAIYHDLETDAFEAWRDGCRIGSFLSQTAAIDGLREHSRQMDRYAEQDRERQRRFGSER